MDTLRRVLIWYLALAVEVAIMVFIATLIDPVLTSTTCGDAGQCAMLAFQQHPVRTLLVDVWVLICILFLWGTVLTMIEDFKSLFRKGDGQQGIDNQ